MGGVKVFNDKEKYKELLAMLNEGFSYSVIAKHFGVDHSSIFHQANKLGRLKGRKFKRTCPKCKRTFYTSYGSKIYCTQTCLERNRTVKTKSLGNSNYSPLDDFYVENGEKIRAGHDYAWYVEQERLRNEKDK